MLVSATGGASHNSRVPVSQIIQVIDRQGGVDPKASQGQLFYRRPPEPEKPRGPIKDSNPRGGSMLQTYISTTC